MDSSDFDYTMICEFCNETVLRDKRGEENPERVEMFHPVQSEILCCVGCWYEMSELYMERRK